MANGASFTGIVTFKNATLVQDTAKFVAPDGYMVETDCPYLSPLSPSAAKPANAPTSV
jgi:TatD DNase family protein